MLPSHGAKVLLYSDYCKYSSIYFFGLLILR
nr:MAG TPA: hypothetical protein [Caudoviricetes sp.]